MNPAVDALLWVTSPGFQLLPVTHALAAVGKFRHLRYVPDWDSSALRAAGAQPDAGHFLAGQRSAGLSSPRSQHHLGGALRNHAEAYRILGVSKKMGFAGRPIPSSHRPAALPARFIRHEHARQQLGAAKQAGSSRSMRCDLPWTAPIHGPPDRTDRAIASAGCAVQNRPRNGKRRPSRFSGAATAEVGCAIASAGIRLAKHCREKYRRHTLASHEPLRALGGRLRALRSASHGLGEEKWPQVTRLHQPLAQPQPSQWFAVRSRPAARPAPAGATVHCQPRPPATDIHHHACARYAQRILHSAIESVRAQWYGQWELCICNDASGRADTLAYLANAAGRLRSAYQAHPPQHIRASSMPPTMHWRWPGAIRLVF